VIPERFWFTLFTLLLWVGGSLVWAAETPARGFKVGEVIPDATCLSIEGIPVSSRPREGKVLLVVADDLDSDQADRLKEAIVLYRRFHAKGLNGVGVCSSKSDDQILKSAFRWQIPWPEVVDRPTTSAKDEGPSFPLLAVKAPDVILIDPQGKVLAVGLEGEQAHETVAKILKVSLNDLPMPKPPEERSEKKPQDLAQVMEFQGSDVRYRLMLGTAEERKEAEPCKKNLRKISIALTDYRADHKGELPQHLSDLFPKYLQDESVLLCPAKPEGLADFKDYADPKMKCSYLYEFSPEVRAAKTKQLGEYGDRVAMVRCKNHGRWLSLSYGGEIYFSSQAVWEADFPRGASLDDDDAKVRERLRILGSALARYKKDKGEVPEELEGLYPEYVKDKALFTCPVTGKPLSYQFSAGTKLKDETYRSYKLKQLKDPLIGEYVPIIRAKGVLRNGNVINLSYGGELYESPMSWEELFK
jgi:hypothetical protein